MPGHVFPENCAFALVDLDPHLIHRSLDPPESKSQMASRSVQPFLHSWRQTVTVLYKWQPLPLKIVPSHGESEPHLIHDSLGPHEFSAKRHVDRFSRFCTAHFRASLCSAMCRPLPSKLPVPMGDLDLHLIHDWAYPSLQPEQHLNWICRFLHSSALSFPILYNGLPLRPSKLLLPMVDLDPHLIYGSLDPPASSIQTASQSVEPFLLGSLRSRQTDRQTDRPRCSVGNNRPHLRT